MGVVFTLKLANIFDRLTKQTLGIISFAAPEELDLSNWGFGEEEAEDDNTYDDFYEIDPLSNYDDSENYEIDYTLKFEPSDTFYDTLEILNREANENPLFSEIIRNIEIFIRDRDKFAEIRNPSPEVFNQINQAFQVVTDNYNEVRTKLHRSGGRLENSIIFLVENAYEEVYKDIEYIFETIKADFHEKDDIEQESAALKNLTDAGERARINKLQADRERSKDPTLKRKRRQDMANYRNRNKEKLREATKNYSRKYYEKNSDKVLDRIKTDRKLNPEKYILSPERKIKKKDYESSDEYRENRKVYFPQLVKKNLSVLIDRTTEDARNLAVIKKTFEDSIISNNYLDSENIEELYQQATDIYEMGLEKLKILEPRFKRFKKKYKEVYDLYEDLFKSIGDYYNIINKYKIEADQVPEEILEINKKRKDAYESIKKMEEKPKKHTRAEQIKLHRAELLSEAMADFKIIEKIRSWFAKITEENLPFNLEEVNKLYAQAIDLHKRGLENLLDIKPKFSTKQLKEDYISLRRDYDSQLEIVTNYYNKMANRNRAMQA